MKNKTILTIATILIFSWHYSAQAKKSTAGSSPECTTYSNAALNASAEERLEKAVPALNKGYNLGYNKAQLDAVLKALKAKIEQGKFNQENLEKAVFFGCTTELSVDDQKPMQDFIASLLE